MGDNIHRAVYPALATHRGTLIRLTLALKDGSNLVVEPLHFPAGGLALRAEGLALFGKEPPVEEGMYLLGLDASPIRRMEIRGADISSVASFVVYPNGFTFSDSVFQQSQLVNLHALVWSSDVARLVKADIASEIFRLGADWPDVPTIVGLPSKEVLDQTRIPRDLRDIVGRSCAYIEHTCPSQCEDRTKRVLRERQEHLL